ncbi:MAG: hypothetical protein JXA20_14790, partial [Spirochaetes bacterium]|nr:hypothetical protein [Spirochaetota bacterium]
MKRYTVSIAVFMSALVVIGLSSARDCHAQGAVQSDAEVSQRIAHIQNALDQGQTRAQAWWYGWIGIYGAGTAVQGGLAAHHWNDFERNRSTNYVRKAAPETRQDMIVGGATTFLGVCGLLVMPFTPAYAPDRLREMPENTPEERRLKLQVAESLLAECAQVEIDGWGWLTHLLNLGVNLTAGLVVWLGFDRPFVDGLLMFAEGEAVSLI